ncbi:MAG: amidohydrolase [Melioribacter sp.]|uniref:amidohydrolase n=1 Tax=Rosettibacter primus TaxID=3111523 RepID=UPI00247D20B4|nr:amidohydrolase [Melioribacter sp.]
MKPKKFILLLIIIILPFLLIKCMKKDMNNAADLVLLNGNVVTMDDSNMYAEAVAIKGNKILSVGSAEEVEKLIGDSTEVIDLDGKFVMPGFIESHAHLIGLGESLVNIDLKNARNWDDIIKLIADAAKNTKPGEWIIGRGWHQEKFNSKPQPNVNGYPVHDKLSEVTPNNPVILFHASGHAIFANAKAMQIAHVDKNTKNPNGGTIVRDKLGNPVGVFEENAEQLITKFYEEYLEKRTAEQIYSDYKRKIQLAVDECIKKGVTSFHDAGETFEIIEIIKQLVDSSKIPIRLYVMINEPVHKLQDYILKDYKLTGYGNNHLTVRSIKQYIDGALGSRGAWLLEPYSDLPNHFGSNVTPIQDLEKICELAIKNDFQMCIHAIGDKGNREVLNLYEKIFKKFPDKKDLRWRIEHAQHLSSQDINRFSKLGIIAAMQGIHCTSDAAFVIERLGEKRAREGAYAWKKLIDNGTIICNGTDAPVEDVDPIKNFYTTVTRKTSIGSYFYPEQKMTRLEALKSYTINGAYASFQENLIGSISIGKLADIVVLSNDLLNCSDEEILSTKVLYTIVDGKILYRTK